MEKETLDVTSGALLSDVYPYVFHYTTLSGLLGILESKTLWATHSSYLNDNQEFRYAERFLLEKFGSTISSLLQGLIEEGKVNIPHGSTPDNIGKTDAKNWIDILYSVTLGLGTPFVASFCSHSIGSREYKDGLLSQWRAYGKDGGFALEFDTKELERAMAKDGRINTHSGYYLTDVLYGDDAKNDVEIISDLQVVSRMVGDTIAYRLAKKSSLPDLRYAWEPFFRCASRVKNEGFAEEKEIRAVYVVSRAAATAGRRPPRAIKFRNNSRDLIPYVELFDSDDIQLPIRRIVVGPHPRSDSRVASIELFLKQRNLEVEVEKSGIPFVPE